MNLRIDCKDYSHFSKKKNESCTLPTNLKIIVKNCKCVCHFRMKGERDKRKKNDKLINDVINQKKIEIEKKEKTKTSCKRMM